LGKLSKKFAGLKRLHIPLWRKPLNTREVGHGYCVTIHKIQGKQQRVVIYFVTDPRRETWRHFYTAITRSTDLMIIIGRREDINAIIRNDPADRRSGLRWRLACSRLA